MPYKDPEAEREYRRRRYAFRKANDPNFAAIKTAREKRRYARVRADPERMAKKNAKQQRYLARRQDDADFLARRRASKRRYEARARQNPEWRAARVEQKRKGRQRYPERHRARTAVSDAIRGGLLVRPDVCSGCGREGRVEAHHVDYSKPLDVIWLCKVCHVEADKIMRGASHLPS